MRARNAPIPSVPARSRLENIAVQSVRLWKRLLTLIANVGMRVVKGKSNRSTPADLKKGEAGELRRNPRIARSLLSGRHVSPCERTSGSSCRALPRMSPAPFRPRLVQLNPERRIRFSLQGPELQQPAALNQGHRSGSIPSRCCRAMSVKRPEEVRSKRSKE